MFCVELVNYYAITASIIQLLLLMFPKGASNSAVLCRQPLIRFNRAG